MFLRNINRSSDNQGKELSDSEIIARYKDDHNTEWVGILFDRYIHLVFGVCLKYLKNKEDSEDAVIHVFENLLEDLLRHKIQNFKSWLYTLTKNFCLMQLRKSGSRNLVQTYPEEKIYYSLVESMYEMHQINEANQDLLLEKLSFAITQLSEEQAKCIELMYLKERSYVEIARITGYNMKQVKSYIQNGKRNLKKLLSERDD